MPAAADAVIVGAGIAGASAAFELKAHLERVVLLEREPLPGHHTTGRSAAFRVESYGGPVVRRLTRASRRFFESPPAGFADHPLVHPNPVLWIAREAQRAALEARLARARATGAALEAASPREALALCPVLRPEAVAAAAIEADADHIDVAGLLAAYLRGFRARGGTVRTRAEVVEIRRIASGVPGSAARFRIRAGDETWTTPLLVDAAGAWADGVARRAGARPLGLRPLRRTAIAFDPPPGLEVRALPCVIDAEERFYVKPEGRTLLASPCDETEMEPGDVQPDPADIALAAERVMEATTLEIRHLRRAWAGLRTFAPDRAPVIGEAPELPGFFWLAGQGGFGIMTAPAAARALAGLAITGDLPEDLRALGVRPADLAPDRFRGAADRRDPGAPAGAPAPAPDGG